MIDYSTPLKIRYILHPPLVQVQVAHAVSVPHHGYSKGIYVWYVYVYVYVYNM